MKHRALLLTLALCLLPALAAAADLDRPELARLFAERGFVGCFAVKTGAEVLRVNPERAATPFRPASTFKIVNALVALESGVAPNTEFALPWDGVVREVPAWNRDLTLEQAFRASAIWYFVELGKRNGRERLGEAMRGLGYGNADASGSDQFWIDGGLRISADGQVRVLDRLQRGETAFSTRSVTLLRQMMLTDKGVGPDGAWALYAKTGMAPHGSGAADAPVGWLVGWVERGGRTFPFALNITALPGEAKPMAKLAPARLELARILLDRLGILPAK
ncbi:penicillin-binding transpeptidase domain-containing protein [Humidesulfovibrio idahonensis]